MNATSASRAESVGSAAEAPRILVWDAPVRVFHGLMVLCFALAWLTAESERWRLVHVSAGYTVAGLVAFRLIWGFVGTRYARFSQFVRSPAEAWNDLRDLLQGKAGHTVGHPVGHTVGHTVGHNPAGAWAILGLLSLAAGTALSGWATDREWGGHAVEELHEGLAQGLLLLVGVHVAGVIVSSLAHRENLVRAMVTGLRRGAPDQALRSARAGLAMVLLAAVLAFWGWQWQTAPVAPVDGGPVGMAAHHGGQGDGDDDDDDDD